MRTDKAHQQTKQKPKWIQQYLTKIDFKPNKAIVVAYFFYSFVFWSLVFWGTHHLAPKYITHRVLFFFYKCPTLA